jgi:ABC-2 type transport system ATP-binding protein
MYIIESEDLVKKYGKVIALDNVTLKIKRGIFGLLGPNGAGKTSFMRIIVGLSRKTSGRVEVLGMDPWEEGEKVRRKVGFMPEKPAFPPHLTGRRILELITRLRGYELSKSLELADVLGLRRRIDSTIGGYSAGMRSRLAFCISLVGDPDLLVLDEPVANLDPLGRIRLLSILRERSKDGCSVVIATHSLRDVEDLLDSAAFIHRGRILDSGDIGDLMRRYMGYQPEEKVADIERLYMGVMHEKAHDLDEI